MKSSFRASRALFIGYGLISAILSAVIITRFLLPPSFYIQCLNVGLYFIFFLLMPLCAFFVLVVVSWTRNSPLKWFTVSLFFAWTLRLLFLMPFLAQAPPLVPDYFFFWAPLPIALVLTEKSKRNLKTLRRNKTVLVVTSIVIFSILPLEAAAAGDRQILGTALSITATPQQRHVSLTPE